MHDLIMQSANVLRRAAERSVRGLRTLDEGPTAGLDRREALGEVLGDYQADLASLRVLQATADHLLRECMEAEAFQRFCEIALATAEMTLQGTSAAEKAALDFAVVDPQQGRLFLAQIKENAIEVQEICSEFRRLAEWLRIPPPALPPSVLEQLTSLPPVTGPRRSGDDSPNDSDAGV
jgi:hypothetical protein